MGAWDEDIDSNFQGQGTSNLQPIYTKILLKEN